MRKKKLEAHSEFSIAQDVTEVGFSCEKLKLRSRSSRDMAGSLFSTKRFFSRVSSEVRHCGRWGQSRSSPFSQENTMSHLSVYKAT